LIEVSIGSEPASEKAAVMVWVDTAFNGGLVLPRTEIDKLGLKECSSTPAVLAVTK
jgi:predicted aspartyl protease